MIVRGFKQAAKKALAHLDTITENTGKALNDVALTAMTGKSAEDDGDHLVALCVEAARDVPLQPM